MDTTKEIFGQIEKEIERQAQLGKSNTHTSQVWLTIVVDYIGRAVRYCYRGEEADEAMILKATTVMVQWLKYLRRASNQ